MKFDDVLAKYRSISFSERDKGTRFERLMRAYLLTDPKYTFKNVWLWEDFSVREELGGIDTGIDLVAETAGGEFWAVQCKCYEESKKIDKGDLDTFISTSGRTFTYESSEVGFAARLFVSTTDVWTSNAENVIKGQAIPVIRINLNDLRNAPVDWDKLESDTHGEAARVQRHTLKPHQSEAVDKVCEYFKHRERGKLIMACGTGKTFTSLKIMEREAERLALVLVPSIALVGQILREWTAHAEKPLNTICVCSDPKISQSRKKNATDSDAYSTVDLSVPATTDPKRIVEQCAKGGLTVVFSTYQSIEAVEKAQKQGLPEFDLIVCDEAHRTTGVKLSGDDESAFIRVHNNDLIKTKKRLYMTATPRLYNEDSKSKAKKNDAILCSMDDEELYGAEIHRIGFGEAVEKGLLTDYKVLIFTVSDKDIPQAVQNIITSKTSELNIDDVGAKIVGCINALSKQVWGAGCDAFIAADPQPMNRAVAFCNSIANSKGVTDLFNEITKAYIDELPTERRGKITGIESKHIDGTFNAPRRDELLNWIKDDTTDGTCKILSNVRCLSEGVDVPALDAVMFLSARNSQVDVVQSVGRVMRLAEGKKYGYIIIPIIVPSDVEPDKALDDNERYKVVWTVLNALRAHDDRFNAMVNSIELNKKKPDKITIGGIEPWGDDGSDGSPQTNTQLQLIDFEGLQNVIYARLVQKVGSRPYWENWAKSVADIAQREIKRITDAVSVSYSEPKRNFDHFLEEVKVGIDASITKESAIEMLAQHLITAPVFDALFDNYEFAKNNAVSIAMDLTLESFDNDENFAEDKKVLNSFYDSVRERAEAIKTAEGRHKVINELYNTFFKTAFPKMTEKLGIVYTPIEVVDFIIHSVSDVLKIEFGRSISDENVNILDPFTGTGTFIARLIQSGLIDKADLPRKYKHELFANEIVLLAYYIACVNIENAYHDVVGMDEYETFKGIALTDTFQAYEDYINEPTRMAFGMLDENSERVKRQNTSPITIIFGNPPYFGGKKSANDDTQSKSYPIIDSAIASKYIALSNSKSVKDIYDPYIRAFRLATDKLNGDGIVCFVSNGSWLDNNMDGYRKSIEEEFSKIYVFNLRGNALGSGELRRKEAGNVFGGKSRTSVSITLLVKRKNHEGKAKILYIDIGDFLKEREKLDVIKSYKSFFTDDVKLKEIRPDKHGNWIIKLNKSFDSFISLAIDEKKKKFNTKNESFFVVHSLGVNTNRDAWVWNFSEKSMLCNMHRMVEFYNFQVGKKETDYDSTKIAWSSSLTSHWQRGQKAIFDENQKKMALYRPFNQQHLYWGDKMIHRRGQFSEFFPTVNSKNLIISVNCKNKKGLSCLISDKYVDLHFVGDTQCFPRYYYKKKEITEQLSLMREGDDVEEYTQYERKDAISDYIFNLVQEKYGAAVTKGNIFFYVYGYLHSPKYRETFADDLKKSLPRIPLVETADEFWKFSKAGEALAQLHLGYENVPPLPEVEVKGDNGNYHVEKMRFKSKADKSMIVYNSAITIENIPLKAYEYVVNGKSAIEWVMERYQVKTDKDSGIVNDPNLYAAEVGNELYVLDLLLSVIAVSVRTVEIVEKMEDKNNGSD